MHYNASLRGFPGWVLETMQGNRYVTTIHCINSYIIKVSRATPVRPRYVYRGSKGMRLPLEFAVKDQLGKQGAVEMGFTSCTATRCLRVPCMVCCCTWCVAARRLLLTRFQNIDSKRFAKFPCA